VGLGKTVQALGASQHPTLIICPSRAIGVWVEEIHN
jgi:SNF2 family DNA or RNA helicase